MWLPFARCDLPSFPPAPDQIFCLKKQNKTQTKPPCSVMTFLLLKILISCETAECDKAAGGQQGGLGMDLNKQTQTGVMSPSSSSPS